MVGAFSGSSLGADAEKGVVVEVSVGLEARGAASQLPRLLGAAWRFGSGHLDHRSRPTTEVQMEGFQVVRMPL